MDNYDMYISLILVIKIGFYLMVISDIYLKVKGESESDLDKRIVYWKKRIEFIFVLLMAILLIYLFNPTKNRIVMIDGETNVLLYMFGFVLLITADWGDFFYESKWFKYIQKSVQN